MNKAARNRFLLIAAAVLAGYMAAPTLRKLPVVKQLPQF